MSCAAAFFGDIALTDEDIAAVGLELTALKTTAYGGEGIGWGNRLNTDGKSIAHVHKQSIDDKSDRQQASFSHHHSVAKGNENDRNEPHSKLQHQQLYPQQLPMRMKPSDTLPDDKASKHRHRHKKVRQGSKQKRHKKDDVSKKDHRSLQQRRAVQDDYSTAHKGQGYIYDSPYHRGVAASRTVNEKWMLQQQQTQQKIIDHLKSTSSTHSLQSNSQVISNER